MAEAVETKATVGHAFPVTEVEAQLRKELMVAVEIAADIAGVTLPTDPAGKASASVQIDSLVVVEIICSVEPIVDFELENSIVRAGGYKSINHALQSLIPRIEKEWIKRKGGKK